jgi:transposase
VQGHRITINLGLPGLVVMGMEEGERLIEVVARYSQREASCPRCGRPTWQVHQWHRQLKRDAKVWDKEVWLLLWKRRFRCRACGKDTWPDPACGARRRTTKRLRRVVARRAQEATVRAVARMEGVSEGLVERSWRELYARPLPKGPHRLLGLDGFSFRRRGRMWTGLRDLEGRRPIAFVAGEGQGPAEALLGRPAHGHTVAVAMDLWEAYRQAVQTVLPQAAVVADKLHVLALVERALQAVHGQRRRPGTTAWLLPRGAERLRPQERQRLMAALLRDEPLARAWGLKESLRSLYRLQDPRQAQEALWRWLKEAEASGLAPFQRAAATLRRWQRELLNYFHHPITNALVEGKHNRIKALKRRGYGYRNERRFLLRILSHTH